MFRLGILAGLSVFLAATPLTSTAGLNLDGVFSFDGSGTGVPVFGFLKLPTSARSIGLAAATLTTDEEATMVQGNPAGLGLVRDYDYSFSHAEILGEFRHENIAFAWPTQDWGGFGGSANILSTTAFEDARDIDENPTKPTASDMAFGLAYGRELLDGLILTGGRLDLIRSTLDGTRAYGYGMNAGILFLLMHDIRLAVVLKNLSQGVQYDTRTAPVEPLPLGLGVELGKPLLDSRWSLQVGLQHGNEAVTHYYAGGEARPIPYLVLRMGYDGSLQDRQLGTWAGLAMGIGIKYDNLTLDYGYKALGPLGAYHAFSLNYSHKAKFRPKDEVLMEASQAKYQKGKYTQALNLARAAVAANPYNFKAQALVQKLQFEINRGNGSAISIYYTANTDGHLSSEWKNGRPIGGLARRKTKLLELKGTPGKSLFLDAGNLTDAKATVGQEHYLYGAYAQMPYDVVNIGAAELAMGRDRWDSRLPLLSSQKPLSEGLDRLTSEKILKLKLGGEIRVLGGMDPANIKGDPLKGKTLEAVADMVRRSMGDPKQQRILIVLFNGTFQSARLLADKVPDIDAIILSGETQMFGSPMKVGNTLICSPGRGGTHVGDLTFLLDSLGEIHSFRHFLLPLDASIPEDPELKKFLSPVTVDPNQFTLEGNDDDYHAQVFAYIQSADSVDQGKLFLHDMHTGREYGIPSEGQSCAQPTLGYGKNKVAFIGEEGSGTREIYAYAPTPGKLDTLTRMGGRALDIHWILNNNAILAVYELEGKRDLYRIDPWNHEVRNLTQGHFGRVDGFSVTKTGDRLALNSWQSNLSTLWVTNLELESPLAVASKSQILGSPAWNAQGDKLAFLEASTQTDSKAPQADSTARLTGQTKTLDLTGELRVLDFADKKMLTATERSHVRGFSWSADGKRVFYFAGINLTDINVFNPDSLTLNKVTQMASSPRSEENPVPKLFGNRDGLLFESVTEGHRKIIWMDLSTRQEKVLADSTVINSLK